MRMSTQRDSLTLMHDVCAGPQRDIGLDLTDLTFVDEAAARCLAAACSALRADSRSVTVTSGPPMRAAQWDGGQP